MYCLAPQAASDTYFEGNGLERVSSMTQSELLATRDHNC
jgi:hypothetical protein